MPSFSGNVLRTQDWEVLKETASELVKRVSIPINSTTPPSLVDAISQDPFQQAGKYGLAWVYFGVILVVGSSLFRIYNYWGDKIRTALYKEEIINSALSMSPSNDHYQDPFSARTENSTRHFFPSEGPLVINSQQPSLSSIAIINNTVALFRYIFYRPIPQLKIFHWRFTFPSLACIVIITIGCMFSLLYCFLPAPLYYSTMEYGSPPLAIRAGMLSIALLPWTVALAAKVNFISLLTGIGSERLIVFHRWGAYICILLAIIHAVPFWYQSIRDSEGFAIYQLYFTQTYSIYTTGICALVPLLFLFFHSLPILRRKYFEAFALLHIPVSWIFIGMLFWHCHNYLTSWSYLYATVILMIASLIGRLFYLNWMNPIRTSWLIGEESVVTILPENAIKVTVPTRTRWRPGQYAYLRMPGIAVMENHPFTISSLCSDDFPSGYGENYRDLTMVFRPFGGFTRKVYETALLKGPYKTYRAFLEGPYGGMQRQISSFDQVIFFAGGSGITAIASQLLDLIKRMRDGKATTRTVHVIWAMKRPDIMDWFKEELRICREFAPFNSVHCHFFITSAKRSETNIFAHGSSHNPRLSGLITTKIDQVLSSVGSKRNSASIQGQLDLRREDEDHLTALPQAHLVPNATPMLHFPPPPKSQQGKKKKDKKKSSSQLTDMKMDVDTLPQTDRLYNAHRNVARHSVRHDNFETFPPTEPIPLSNLDMQKMHQQSPDKEFDFGFPTSPNKFQQSMMHFAYLPGTDPSSDRYNTQTHMQDLKPPPPSAVVTLAHSAFDQYLHGEYPDDKKEALPGTYDYTYPDPYNDRDTKTFYPHIQDDNIKSTPVDSGGDTKPPTSHLQLPPLNASTYTQSQPDAPLSIPYARPHSDGWRTEYGRPNIPDILRGLSRTFPRRTCVYVCGPPAMRIDVSRTIADLQKVIWQSSERDELFLHAENYAI